eukprot:240340-Chlamydomonas_euryale.AAC.2
MHALVTGWLCEWARGRLRFRNTSDSVSGRVVSIVWEGCEHSVGGLCEWEGCEHSVGGLCECKGEAGCGAGTLLTLAPPGWDTSDSVSNWVGRRGACGMYLCLALAWPTLWPSLSSVFVFCAWSLAWSWAWQGLM